MSLIGNMSRLHDLARHLMELGKLLEALPDMELKTGKEFSSAALKKRSPHQRGSSVSWDTGVEKLAAEQASFEEDLQFYKEHLFQFLSEYRGKYIAIHNRQVVDSDTDFSRLAERVYAKFGYRDIFMPKVEDPRVVTIPSPRLVGRS